MIALFIILTFAVFVLLDHILLRRNPTFIEEMAAPPERPFSYHFLPSLR